MAEKEVSEADDLVAAKATELKKELQKLVKAILEEDDSGLDLIDRAIRTLSSLRELKIKKVDGNGSLVPEKFRCPISGEIMSDPVILETGQTYDRTYIERWLKEGNLTCPKTQKVLAHTILTPNHVVREMISLWGQEHGFDLPQDTHDDVATKTDRSSINSLLKKIMSSTLSDQKQAAKELRLLTKRSPSVRAIFCEFPDSIHQLLNPFLLGKAGAHPDLEEDLVTIVFNISIHDDNKRLIAEDPIVVPFLIESLKSGTIERRRNAAAALFTLSALDSNKLLIGELGAFNPLIKLLDEGHPLAMKDVASALFSLCLVLENRGRAIQEGAVEVILRKIKDDILVEELLAVLAILSSHLEAVEEMKWLGAIPCLLRIIREGNCNHSKENSVAILYTMCKSDRSLLVEINEEENANSSLSRLAQSGNSRAKRKVNGILERLQKASSLSRSV